MEGCSSSAGGREGESGTRVTADVASFPESSPINSNSLNLFSHGTFGMHSNSEE